MHQIQVWLATPAQRRDANCIGDIRLQAGAIDYCAPVQAVFCRPDGGGPSSQRLRYSGLERPMLLTHITEVVDIIYRDRARRCAPPRIGTVLNGITLTVSDIDEEALVARLTVTPQRGRPLTYQAVWAIEDYGLAYTLRLEVNRQPHPWELLHTVCTTLLAIQSCPGTTALQFLLVRETQNGFTAL